MDTTSLTAQETQRLRELEEIIQEGFDSFLRTGLAFAEVRFHRLYRATHDRFEDYCRDRWALSLSRCNQIINTVKVVENITGAFPEEATVLGEANEHTLRPLSRLEPELQTATWELIRHIEQRPRGTTIEQVVGAIKTAIESGWQERETRCTPSPSNGRNGGCQTHERRSDELGNFCRWAHRIDSWDPEAIVAADDNLCLKRRLEAATQLKGFCEELIRTIETRLQATMA